MSVATKAALDEALAAHVASTTPGSMVTGYVLYAATMTLEQLQDEKTAYFAEYSEGLPMHSAIGLATKQVDQLRFPEDD